MIRSSTIAGIGLAAAVVTAANLPSGVPLPDPAQTLSVSFGGSPIQQPGQVFQKPQTLVPPKVSLPTLNSESGSSYLLLFIDPSVFINATVGHTTALQGINGDLRPSANGSLTSTSAPIAPYIYPQAQAGQPAHDYTLLLFQQPQNYTVPEKFAPYLPLSNFYQRTDFPLLDFIHGTGLDNPIAANWFREGPAEGNSTQSSATSKTPTGSATQSTGTAVYTGAASRMEREAMIWACVFAVGGALSL